MISLRRNTNLLLIPAILSYLGILVDDIINENTIQFNSPSLILLLFFGIAFFGPLEFYGKRWLKVPQIIIETILVSVILIMHPGWSVYPILFFMVSAQVSIFFTQRLTYVWIFIFTIITSIIFLSNDSTTGLVALLPYIAGYWFFGIFGWMRTQAENDRLRSEALLIELQESHAKLKDYAIRVEELAIVQERNRIAREVHDSLGHRLTVASVQLEGAQRLVQSNPNRAEQIIATVRDQVREGLAELRRTVAMLRSSIEEELPLSDALISLVKQFEEATHLIIHLNLEECPESQPFAFKHSFYHAVQEGLTNVQRHTQATEVWITFQNRNKKITVLIGDNGTGLPLESHSKSTHFGLKGLEEQATLLGGSFHIDPRPGGGFQLSFCLPEIMEPAHE